MFRSLDSGIVYGYQPPVMWCQLTSSFIHPHVAYNLNLASEEVILELVRAKCIPILLYGLECFHLGKADLHSLDFTLKPSLYETF